MARNASDGKDNCSETTDMSRGFWRKIYAGELTDKRVNALTMGAELTMHRLILQADDFGNLQGDRDLMLVQTYPRRRDVTPEQFAAWLDELDAGQFITFYEADGDHYCHINGWMLTQPPPRNGKRVRRHPEPPLPLDESGCTDKGESGCVQVHPRRNSPDPTQTRPDQEKTQPTPVQTEQPTTTDNGSGGNGSAHAMGSGGSGRTGGLADVLPAEITPEQMQRISTVMRSSEVMRTLKELGVEAAEALREISEKRYITPELVAQVHAATKADPKTDDALKLTITRLRTWNPDKLKALSDKAKNIQPAGRAKPA